MSFIMLYKTATATSIKAMGFIMLYKTATATSIKRSLIKQC